MRSARNAGVWLGAFASGLFLIAGFSRAGEDALIEAQGKVPTIDSRQLQASWGDASAAAEKISWIEAQNIIAKTWRGLARRFEITGEQAQFLQNNKLEIRFVPLKKLGTYDHHAKEAQFQDGYFKENWLQLRELGMGGKSAALRLGAKSFPGFIHVLRDGMLREELEREGFVHTGGWSEGEVIHFKEQAAVAQELRRLFPESRDKRIAIDEETDNIVDLAAKGNAALADLVRDLYKGMPSVFLSDAQNKALGKGNNVHDLEEAYKECQKSKQAGGCRGFSFSGKEFIFGPGVPCYSKFSAAPPSQGGFYQSPFSAPSPSGRIEFYRCDKDWESSLPPIINFLKNDGERQRLRRYYRGMLAKHGITPEELQ